MSVFCSRCGQKADNPQYGSCINNTHHFWQPMSPEMEKQWEQQKKMQAAMSIFMIVVALIIAAVILASMIVFSPGILIASVIYSKYKMSTAVLWAVVVVVSLIIFALVYAVLGKKQAFVLYGTLAGIISFGGAIYMFSDVQHKGSLWVTIAALYPFFPLEQPTMTQTTASLEEDQSYGAKARIKRSHVRQTATSLEYNQTNQGTDSGDKITESTTSSSVSSATLPSTSSLSSPLDTASLVSRKNTPENIVSTLKQGMPLTDVRQLAEQEGKRTGGVKSSTKKTDIYEFLLSDRALLRCTFTNDNLETWSFEAPEILELSLENTMSEQEEVAGAREP